MTKEKLEDLKKIALDEIKEEIRRQEIDRLKLIIKTKKPFWTKIFPFKIKIERV